MIGSLAKQEASPPVSPVYGATFGVDRVRKALGIASEKFQEWLLHGYIPFKPVKSNGGRVLSSWDFYGTGFTFSQAVEIALFAEIRAVGMPISKVGYSLSWIEKQLGNLIMEEGRNGSARCLVLICQAPGIGNSSDWGYAIIDGSVVGSRQGMRNSKLPTTDRSDLAAMNKDGMREFRLNLADFVKRVERAFLE